MKCTNSSSNAWFETSESEVEKSWPYLMSTAGEELLVPVRSARIKRRRRRGRRGGGGSGSGRGGVGGIKGEGEGVEEEEEEHERAVESISGAIFSSSI